MYGAAPLATAIRLSSAVFWRLVERYRIAAMSAVPTVYGVLAQVPIDADISSLELAIVGRSSTAACRAPGFRGAHWRRTFARGTGSPKRPVPVRGAFPSFRRPDAVGQRMPYQQVKAVRIDAVTGQRDRPGRQRNRDPDDQRPDGVPWLRRPRPRRSDARPRRQGGGRLARHRRSWECRRARVSFGSPGEPRTSLSAAGTISTPSSSKTPSWLTLQSWRPARSALRTRTLVRFPWPTWSWPPEQPSIRTISSPGRRNEFLSRASCTSPGLRPRGTSADRHWQAVQARTTTRRHTTHCWLMPSRSLTTAPDDLVRTRLVDGVVVVELADGVGDDVHRMLDTYPITWTQLERTFGPVANDS